MSVPCGQCIGCRIDYSKMWAARMVHESQLHEENCFLTLTYAPEFIPPGGTLVKQHLQLFFKRLRKKLGSKRIRYYAVGEYGEQSLRPHYHAILFGHDFRDKQLFSRGRGYSVYTSQTLLDVWQLGHCTIGEVNAQTCAYTARYVTKKINGARKAEHYRRLDPESGEVLDVLPEFSTQSRRPGIAADWFHHYRSDVYPDDFVLLDHRRSKTPRFYDKLLDRVEPGLLLQIKSRRMHAARARESDNTAERLAQRETCLKAKLSLNQREPKQ